MRHDQTHSRPAGSQILLLVVLAILLIVFVIQIGFRAGRWTSIPQASREPPPEPKEGNVASPQGMLSPVAMPSPEEIGSSTSPLPRRPEAEIKSDETQPGKAAFEPTSPPPSRVSPSDESQITYTVQVGAFRLREGADRVAAQLRARGYSVSVQPPPPGNLYLVWVGRFQTEGEARDFATRFQRVLTPLGLKGYRVRTTRR